METRRRATGYLVVGLVALGLIAWLTARYLVKRHLIRNLSSNNMTVRVEAARKLLEMEKLVDALPAQPIIRRSKTAEALGEIAAQEGNSPLGEKALRALGVILRDQEDAPRRWARRALTKQGKRAIPTLMAALSAGAGTLEEAIKALVQIGPEAAPMLRFLLSDGSATGGAAEALGNIGGVGIAALIRGCYNDDLALRQVVLDNLGLQQTEAGLQPALYNLKPPQVPNTPAAIKALGLIGDPTAVPNLIPFLKDKDNREVAVTSLGQIGDPRAVEPIIATLMETEKRYRNAAVLALRRIGPPAFPALMRELRSPRVLMRRGAAAALVGSRSPQLTEALAAAVHDSDADVRASAALALGWKDNLAGVTPLVGVLSDPDWHVVDSSVQALGMIGVNAIDKLLLVLSDPAQTLTVRYQVARALAAMGRPAVPRLVAALSRPEPEVRKWTAVALGEIGDQRAAQPLRKLQQTTAGDLKWVIGEQLRRLTGLPGS